MATLKEFATNLINMTKNTIKMRSINKEDFRDTIRKNITRHKKLVSLFNSFSKKEYIDLVSRYISRMKFDKKLPSARVHELYYKELVGKAKRDEDEFFMNSLIKTNEDFVTILEDLDKNFDKFIETNEISILNVRMSQLGVLGIIRQSNVLLNWSMFFYSQFIKVVTGIDDDIAPYRSTYLNTFVVAVATTVTDVRNKQGAYNFLNEATQMKKKNSDLVLNATSNSIGFLNIFNGTNLTKGFIDNLAGVLSVLNIFRWSQEIYEDWKYNVNKANETELVWMENQVALLHEDLKNTSKDDPKYITILKIINAYESKINTYRKKIDEYEKE